MKKRFNFISAILAAAVIAVLLNFGCAFAQDAKPAQDPAATAETIILATTYSVFDTGLLDVILKDFTGKTGITVKPIVVGSGESLKMGERGECDIILAHSPALEEKFMADGFGKDRKSFARNEFYIVGPEGDPAKIKEAKDVFEAFAKLDSAGVFISRGDKSGTHNREMSVWKKAGVDKQASQNYLVTGQGMAETLKMADEKQAYTLCDSATYTFMSEKMKIKNVFADPKNLSNIYSVITVNPEKTKHAKYEPAKKLYDFILSPEVLKIVFEYGKDKFKRSLFEPLEEKK
jgi:tungstate transport system substrate-binding protein